MIHHGADGGKMAVPASDKGGKTPIPAAQEAPSSLVAKTQTKL
jgi:hypothetical protein